MFREMRRKDREMAEADTKALLETAQVGTLATVGADNTPYAVPLSFAYANGVIYLHGALEGKKLDNIRSNSTICFSVVDGVELLPDKFSTKYKSAIVFGKISFVDDMAEKRQGLLAFVKKYSPDYYEEGLQYIENAMEKTMVLKIAVSKMSGKAK